MAVPLAWDLSHYMTRHHDLGRRGEDLAAAFLARRGWRVLARNFRSGHREIDLIVRRGAVVAFVEVKARSRSDYGHPLQAIDWKKRRDIAAVARSWIGEHGQPGDIYRFDAVALLKAGAGRIRLQHVPDAWST